MTDQEGRRRGWGLWVALAVALVLVVGLVATLVAVRAHDPRPHAAPGDVFDHPFQEDPLDDVAEVLLPWARLRVAAGDVRTELPDLLGAEANVQAPDGGSFVRVDVEIDSERPVPLVATTRPFVSEAEVVLRADGREYPIDGPGGIDVDADAPLGSGRGSRWVAVEGEPSEVEVLVTVEGVTQVVDASDGSVDTGRAAGLTDLPTAEEIAAADPVGCGEARRVDRTGLRIDYPERLPCRVDVVLRSPFADGVGWADDGREFLLVQVAPDIGSVSVERRRGDDIEYWDDRDIVLRATLGGEPPLNDAYTNDLNQGAFAVADVDNPRQLVFDVPAGEQLGDLALNLEVAVDRGAPFVTDRATLRVRWDVPGARLTGASA